MILDTILDNSIIISGTILLLVIYVYFSWNTFQAAREHHNTDGECFLAAWLWPAVWVYLAIRGWWRYFEDEAVVTPVRLEEREDLLSLNELDKTLKEYQS